MAKETGKRLEGQNFVIVTDDTCDAEATREILELEGGKVVITSSPDLAMDLALKGRTKGLTIISTIPKRDKKKTR